MLYTKPIFCSENLYLYYTFFHKKVKYLKGYSIVTEQGGHWVAVTFLVVILLN